MVLKRAMILAAAGVLALASVGSAFDVYSDESAFLAAAPAVTMESFESLAVENDYSHASITVQDFTVSVTGSSGMGVYDTPPSWDGHATDGSNFIMISSTPQDLTFAMNNPILAWGINVTDWGDWGAGTLTFRLGSQIVHEMDSTGIVSDEEFFWGYLGDQYFDSITLTNTVSGEAYSFDEVYYGVPEPMTLSMLAAGGLAALRRRKK